MTDQLPAIIEPSGIAERPGGHLVPAPIANAGDQTAWRYIDFFTAHIRNQNVT